jgi:branched-chain amino acid aminotransferase
MKITKAANLKAKPDWKTLGFGKFFTDHMLIIDYKDGAWQEPEIVPYGPFVLDPATVVLHYGQGIFEGLKAYKDKAGKITLFRPEENIKRMNKSAARLCMPELDVDKTLQAINELVLFEKDWIPTDEGTSLYIRPTMIATQAFLGVHPSHTYRFFVILSPVGAYYAAGLKPIKILVEDHYVRSAVGGTGEAKCMGNYAGSLIAAQIAEAKGYSQVLYLDAAEHKYVEEVGAMNMFFVIDGKVITPMLTGSILDGVTRKSAVAILKHDGYTVEERRISIDEIEAASKSGKLQEAFGCGTAAVVSPVGWLGYKGADITITGENMGKVTTYLYDRLTSIQRGKSEDVFNWLVKLN